MHIFKAKLFGRKQKFRMLGYNEPIKDKDLQAFGKYTVEEIQEGNVKFTETLCSGDSTYLHKYRTYIRPLN